jgi:hypothetical protein
MDFNDEGFIVCKHCNGEKVIPRDLHIKEICPVCYGAGGTDWVSHAMGRTSDDSLHLNYRIVHENILRLIDEIKRQGIIMGTDIVVTIEQRRVSYPDHLRWDYKDFMMDIQMLSKRIY